MTNNEKLTICYNAWMIFSENDDYDSLVGEIAERGFNCIRIDDGAGLLWDKDGNVREDVLISSPFGKYTDFTTYHVIVKNKRLNILDRFLRICRAAKKYNVKIVPSSWFYLHTNWFCEENDIKHLFDLSAEEKITYFAEELSKILDVLRRENMIDIVAFAEIFNEFNGISFYGNKRELTSDEITELRLIHEREIDKLKKRHPDVLFAFDCWNPTPQEEWIPRNIDVYNFHLYYAWDLYNSFEKGICFGVTTLDEPDIPDETRYFLKDEIITVKEVVEEMGGNIRTGIDWPRRISLWASVDWNKHEELNDLLEKGFAERVNNYKNHLYKRIDDMLMLHDKVVPNSRIVMGEGTTYCASHILSFERDSKLFWEMLKEQMIYLKKKGLWGTVLTTTHAPGRSAAWECKDLYVEANKLFLDKE